MSASEMAKRIMSETSPRRAREMGLKMWARNDKERSQTKNYKRKNIEGGGVH